MKKNNIWVLIVLATSICLRGPFTGVGAVVSDIQHEFGLSSGATGFITSIPLLAFALGSVLIGMISVKIGTGRCFIMGMISIAAGVIIRSTLGIAGVFVGTVFIGLGIAIGNVLTPSVIKDKFGKSQGIVMGAYAACMSVFSGLSGGMTVHLSDKFGWKIALGVWIIPAFAAVILWMSKHNYHQSLEVTETQKTLQNPYRYSITWKLVFYMGLQAMIYYVIVAWIPQIAADRGFSVIFGGYLVSIFLAMGIPTGLMIPVIASRLKSHRILTIVILGMDFIGILIAYLSGESAFMIVLGTVFCGIGQGSTMPLGLYWFNMHSENARTAAKLSGAVQSCSYVIAAIGPALMGNIYDFTGSWGICFILLLVVVGFDLLFGLLCATDEIISL